MLNENILNLLENPIILIDNQRKIILKNDKVKNIFITQQQLDDFVYKAPFDNNKYRIGINGNNYEVITKRTSEGNLFIELILLKKKDIFISFVANLLKSTEFLITLVSPDFKKIYYCNKPFEEVFNINKNELKEYPNTFIDIIDERDRKKIIEKIKTNENFDLEVRINNIANSNNWYKLTAYKFNENEICYYMLILTDINKQKVNELKLDETNFRFKNTMANLPEAIWIVAKEKDIFYVNKTIKKIIGYSSDELSSKKQIMSLIHPDYKKLLLKKWEQLQRFGKLYDIEFLIKHKNGYYKWVKDTVFHSFKRDNITYYEGVIRDIDKDKKELLIKDVIYKITTAIYGSDDLYSLCRIIHFNMNRLFNTSNLFFALYDEKTNYFTVPYEMDQKDKFESFPADNTLSNYVITQNKPILLKFSEIKRMKKEGKIDYIGTEAKIWMGTPLIYKNKPIGVISLQDYENENHFNEEDLKILELLSYQIAQSIMFKMTEIKLINSERENQAILNVVPDMMFQMDKNGTFLSSRGSSFYVSPQEFLGKRVDEVLPQNLADKINIAIKQALKTENVIKLEYQLNKYEQDQFFEARIVKINDNKVLSIIRNITDSKKYTLAIENSLREKNLLLKEIHHRVKNNMQIISSLLNIQIHTDALKENNKIIKEVQSRIRSMSLVHEKLYENDDISTINLSRYINALAAQLISMFSDDCRGINLQTRITEYNFDLNIAIPLGLLINEVILLLLKHKIFKNVKQRLIKIALSKNENQFELSIKNTGDILRNFGSDNDINYRIIRILVYQIEGELNYLPQNENEINIKFIV